MNKEKYDPELGYSTWWMIITTRRAMSKVRSKETLSYGVTPEQSAVLSIVQAIGDKATPAEISRAMVREANSTTSIISTMVKKGLLTQTKDLERKNMIRVSLTEKGKEIFQKVKKREPVHRIMSALSEEDTHELRRCLKKLQKKALDEARISYKEVF